MKKACTNTQGSLAKGISAHVVFWGVLDFWQNKAEAVCAEFSTLFTACLLCQFTKSIKMNLKWEGAKYLTVHILFYM